MLRTVEERDSMALENMTPSPAQIGQVTPPHKEDPNIPEDGVVQDDYEGVVESELAYQNRSAVFNRVASHKQSIVFLHKQSKIYYNNDPSSPQFTTEADELNKIQ